MLRDRMQRALKEGMVAHKLYGQLCDYTAYMVYVVLEL